MKLVNHQFTIAKNIKNIMCSTYYIKSNDKKLAVVLVPVGDIIEADNTLNIPCRYRYCIKNLQQIIAFRVCRKSSQEIFIEFLTTYSMSGPASRELLRSDIVASDDSDGIWQ